MAPVILRLQMEPDKFKIVVCVTGQHRSMLDQVLKVFEIVPDYDLNTMVPHQTLFDITSHILQKIQNVLVKEKPDVVLVQGDATSAFVGAMAAFYQRISIGHIEAGLRTYQKYAPFPEEGNRHMISNIADFHFAPTQWAKENLLAERIDKDKVWVTGNTVVDSLHYVLKKQKEEANDIRLRKYFDVKWNINFDVMKQRSEKLILVTGHRRESFGKGFESICQALKQISQARRDSVIVYPVHLNPEVQAPVYSLLSKEPNIKLIEPLEYEPFVYLMDQSHCILTDSGGIQEEAPALGKPVLVMRETTERPEGIDAGVVKLVGIKQEDIVRATLELLEGGDVYRRMSLGANPYGDGKASERIASILLKREHDAEINI